MGRGNIPNITAHTSTNNPAMAHPTISTGLQSNAFPIWNVAVTKAVFGKTKEKKVIWKLALECSGLAYFQKLPTETIKNLHRTRH